MEAKQCPSCGRVPEIDPDNPEYDEMAFTGMCRECVLNVGIFRAAQWSQEHGIPTQMRTPVPSEEESDELFNTAWDFAAKASVAQLHAKLTELHIAIEPELEEAWKEGTDHDLLVQEFHSLVMDLGMCGPLSLQDLLAALRSDGLEPIVASEEEDRIDVGLPNDPTYFHVLLTPQKLAMLEEDGEIDYDEDGDPFYTGTERLRG